MDFYYRTFFVFLLSFVLGGAWAQSESISGKVYDESSGVPLAFVNVVAQGDNFGTTSDIDGRFQLKVGTACTHIQLSFVGYETAVIPINRVDKKLVVRLKPTAYDLSEVVIVPGINPAHRIVRLAIKNRDKNDPDRLSSYTCDIYDKFYLTIDTASIISPEQAVSEDSTSAELFDLMDKTHFFLVENAIEKTHLSPDRDFEKVVATRVSGLKDPMFLFLLSQMQSPDFYKSSIKIGGKTYPNPISRGSLSRYAFTIEDTAYSESRDTLFMLSFRPKLKTNFEGMKGIITINSNGWAIQNVKAEPANEQGQVSMSIQQMYRQVDSGQWFPYQLNSDLILSQMVEVRDSVGDSLQVYSPSLVGIGRSYIKEINLNPEIKRSALGPPGVEVESGATKQDNARWTDFREDSLTQKELNTYHFVDSISKAENVERIATTIFALMEGKVKWGKVNFLLDKFMDYNVYEGFVLGLGLETNKDFSNRLHLGGFFNYGFKDKEMKYGGEADYTFNRQRALKFHLGYMHDNSETGGVDLPFTTENLFSPTNYRNFLIERMDLTTKVRAGLSMRVLRFGEVMASFSHSEVNPTYPYSFTPSATPAGSDPSYIFSEVALGMRYAYGERFVTTTHSQVSMGTTYPTIWVNYTHGFKALWDSDYEYNKIDFRIKKSIEWNYYGTTSVVCNAGIVDRSLPAAKLFNGNGSYYDFTIFAPNSFATMRMNEFLNDRYAALFFTHDFKDLIWKREKGIFRPELALHSNMGWGDLSHPEDHTGISTTSMSNGYFESGLTANLLKFGFTKVGFGAFYRYGSYRFDSFKEDVAWKISFGFSL